MCSRLAACVSIGAHFEVRYKGHTKGIRSYSLCMPYAFHRLTPSHVLTIAARHQQTCEATPAQTCSTCLMSVRKCLSVVASRLQRDYKGTTNDAVFCCGSPALSGEPERWQAGSPPVCGGQGSSGQAYYTLWGLCIAYSVVLMMY